MDNWARLLQIPVLCAGLGCSCLLAQSPRPLQGPGGPDPVAQVLSPVPLEWVPPALLQLQAQAAVKSSFTLDRNMLGAAAGMLTDSDADVKQTVRTLDRCWWRKPACCPIPPQTWNRPAGSWMG